MWANLHLFKVEQTFFTLPVLYFSSHLKLHDQIFFFSNKREFKSGGNISTQQHLVFLSFNDHEAQKAVTSLRRIQTQTLLSSFSSQVLLRTQKREKKDERRKAVNIPLLRFSSASPRWRQMKRERERNRSLDVKQSSQKSPSFSTQTHRERKWKARGGSRRKNISSLLLSSS